MPNLFLLLSPAKNYLALDWHPTAKKLFYNEKAADHVELDQSYDDAPIVKKTIQLDECLSLYTTEEKLGEDDAW